MSVKVLETKENSDGTATFTIEYDQEFYDYVKEKTGKEHITEQDVSVLVIELIEKEVEKEDIKCIGKQ